MKNLNHKQNSLRYDERELDPSATIEEFSAVRKEGSRLVQRKIISGVWIKPRRLVRKKCSLAARVSDTLKAELGAMAGRFQSEDEWLQGVRAHLKEIADDPAEYVDSWDLESEERVTAIMMRTCAAELFNRVDKILAMPMNKRGSRGC